MRTCGQCKHFIGAGDWNLCCDKPPKKAKEFYCGWLCYRNTEADDCENFEKIYCISNKNAAKFINNDNIIFKGKCKTVTIETSMDILE